MTIMSIEIDEALAEAVRRKAHQVGKTPEKVAVEALAEQFGKPTPAGNKEWIKKFLENADQVRGNSGGWKWNREELYER